MAASSSGVPPGNGEKESIRNRAAMLREAILNSSIDAKTQPDARPDQPAIRRRKTGLHMVRFGLPEVIAVLVLILLLAATTVISGNRKTVFLRETRTSVSYRMNNLALGIKNALEQRGALLAGLAAMINLHSDDETLRSEFDTYASGIYSGDSGILAIQAYPSQGTNYIYPQEENRLLREHTLEALLADERETVRADIVKALSAETVVVSDPYMVRDGVEGVALRKAVRLGPTVWGICSVLLDLDVLLFNTGFGTNDPDLSISLHDSRGRLFRGMEPPSGMAVITSRFSFPGGEWTLTAWPTGGWMRVVASRYNLYLVSGIAFSLLIAILVRALLNFYGSIRSSLSESEQERISYAVKLDLAVKSSRVGFFEYDTATNLVRRSAEYEKQLGYEPGSMPPEAGFWEASLHPDDRQNALKVSGDCLAGKTSEYELQYRIRHRDGSWRWILGRGVVQMDRNGAVVGLVGCHVDITNIKTSEEALRSMLVEGDRSREALLGMLEDQRLLEQKIRALNSELEDRVRERTAELELSNRNLAAANRELESFSYSVSHDLRTPLRAMSGFAELLEAGYADVLDERALHYVRRIREASVMMGQLINDLLRLAQVSRTPLEKSRLDLSAMLVRIGTALAERNPGRTVRFSVQEGMMTWGDSRLIEIAMGNLLENAWKYTSRTDEAVISVSAEYSPVTESGREVVISPGNDAGINGINDEVSETQNVPQDRMLSAIFSVKDNGVGFDMAYADKLFKPFQRLHRSADFPGTGIGLVIVQRIIQRHGGWVKAQAQEGKGAVFSFQLASPETADYSER